MAEDPLEKVISFCKIYRDLSCDYISSQCVEIRRMGFYMYPEDSPPLNPVRILATPDKLILEVLNRNHKELELPADDWKIDTFVKNLSSYGQQTLCPGLSKKDLAEFKYAQAKNAIRYSEPYERIEGPRCLLYSGCLRRRSNVQPIKKCKYCIRYIIRLRHFDKNEARPRECRELQGIQEISNESNKNLGPKSVKRVTAKRRKATPSKCKIELNELGMPMW